MRQTRLAACAGLALALHGALLMMSFGARLPAADGQPHAALVARLVELPPVAATQPAARDPETAAATREVQAQPTPTPPSSDNTLASAPGAPDRYPPRLGGDHPELGFPDAQLPDNGVRLRAYLALDATGAPAAISVATPPGVPAAFAKFAELLLRRQSLLAEGAPTGANGLAYCLLVRFEPEDTEPRIEWLPGAARDSARCLDGPARVSRPITARP